MNRISIGRKVLRLSEIQTCDDYAYAVRVIAGAMFARLFHHYFGDMTVILKGEGPDGENLSFAADGEWCDFNFREGMPSAVEREKLYEHVAGCESPECVDSWERIRLVRPLIQEGRLPGASSLMDIAADKMESVIGRTTFRRNNLHIKVRELKPCMLWMQQYTGDWVDHR